MKTKERLTLALTEAGAPEWMIKNAENGQYDDFESQHPTPISQLVTDCRANRMDAIAQRAIEGDFDATNEESEAWFQREGKDLFR